MRKFVVGLMCSLICFSPVALTACSKEGTIIQTEDRNIVSIELKEGTMPDVIFVGKFDEAGIILLIRYNDGFYFG